MRIKKWSQIYESSKHFDKYSIGMYGALPTYDEITSKIIRGEIITSQESELLDDISGYKDIYQITKKWLKDQFNIFKKLSYDDVEDRLV